MHGAPEGAPFRVIAQLYFTWYNALQLILIPVHPRMESFLMAVKLTLIGGTDAETPEAAAPVRQQARLYVQTDPPKVPSGEEDVTIFAVITGPSILSEEQRRGMHDLFRSDGMPDGFDSMIEIIECRQMTVVTFPSGCPVTRCARALEHIGCTVTIVNVSSPLFNEELLKLCDPQTLA